MGMCGVTYLLIAEFRRLGYLQSITRLARRASVESGTRAVTRKGYASTRLMRNGPDVYARSRRPVRRRGGDPSATLSRVRLYDGQNQGGG